MKHSAKAGMISAPQLFCVLMIVRIESLVPVKGGFSFSGFFHLGYSFLLSLLVGTVALIIYSKIKNPDVFKKFAVLFFVVGAALCAARILFFTMFMSDAVHPDVSEYVVAVLLLAAAIYSSRLGLEAISRFSFLCTFVIVTAVSICILCNVHNYEIDNFKAFADYHKNLDVNVIDWLMCFDVPFVFLSIAEKTNGDLKKPLFLSIVVSYAVTLAIYVAFVAVLGASAKVYSYPVFTMLQLGEIGSFTRLDIIYYSAWLFVLFFKLSVFVYCGFWKYKRRKKIEKCH